MHRCPAGTVSTLRSVSRHLRTALGNGTGRSLPPVICWYLLIIWGIFVVVAAIDFESRRELADSFGYRIDDLASDLPRALALIPIAPFVNVGVLQVLYVTAVLATLGPRLVEREGSVRTAAVFLGTGILAALIAGLALHVVDGRWLSHPIFDEAWVRSWNGGSAGCYGLAGFLASRSQRPWLLLVTVLCWELGLSLGYLRSYTPAFHVSALVIGFSAGRLIQPRSAGRIVRAA